MWPPRTAASAALPALKEVRKALDYWLPVRKAAAAVEAFALAHLTHRRPAFGITSARVGGEDVPVREEIFHRTPFGTLLHFRKDIKAAQPRVLVLAPMSGHFATLLRDTVQTMLADHDVFITDWHNARDVPLAAGGSASTRRRARHDLPRGDGAGVAPDGDLPALQRRARRRRADGRGRPSGDAAQPDLDGRPDRPPHQPDRGQYARDLETIGESSPT